MIIHVTIKGKEIKLTRKEYLRRFAGNKQNNPYNDKMLRSNPGTGGVEHKKNGRRTTGSRGYRFHSLVNIAVSTLMRNIGRGVLVLW